MPTINFEIYLFLRVILEIVRKVVSLHSEKIALEEPPQIWSSGKPFLFRYFLFMCCVMFGESEILCKINRFPLNSCTMI